MSHSLHQWYYSHRFLPFPLTYDLKNLLILRAFQWRRAQVKCYQITNRYWGCAKLWLLGLSVRATGFFWFLKMTSVCTTMNTIPVVHWASYQQHCITGLASLLFSVSFHPSLFSPLTQLFCRKLRLFEEGKNLSLLNSRERKGKREMIGKE